MVESDQKYVALFIDWDNLVISTAADLGGVAPDLKRIVHKAQQYGVVLLAKAYAEWHTTSDKLAVYRTGVEPVYAPTFRFETEATTRGKSLADPCMVADIVDSLHLFPMVSTYVIVTGDKDMIPVVRLGQLRGKKVVVIGPDFVAGVLRDMADEFVSYRKLVEAETSKAAPEQARRYTAPVPITATDHQHDATASSRAAAPRRSPSAAPAEVTSAKSTPRKDRSTARTPSSERPAASAPGRDQPPAIEGIAEPSTLKPVSSEREVPPATEKPQGPDLAAVFSTITELLQQRAGEGKSRVRATNLKDGLMQRIPGFSERKYGFSKFKDLLTAAESAGLLKVRVAGPVHWVSLPDRSDETAEEQTPQLPANAAESAEVVEREVSVADMVLFIENLRQRSRWLTYTYLLTNMISHFAKTLPQAAAESKARSTLNWLVQEGVLRIDKEPQEVEVAGAKHRVRMCHLQETHELVASTLASVAREPEEAAPVAALEVSVPQKPQQPPEAELAAVGHVQSEEAKHEAVEEEVPAREPAPESGIATPGEELTQPREEAAESAESIELAPEPPALAELQHGLPVPTADDGLSPSEAPAGIGRDEAPDDREAGETSQTSLPEVFAVLARLVEESTGPKRPRLGAAGLKVRLTKTLGDFDERTYGFSRFKDFLKSAENHGYVRLQTIGQMTWVLPNRDDGIPAQEVREHGQEIEAETRAEVHA